MKLVSASIIILSGSIILSALIVAHPRQHNFAMGVAGVGAILAIAGIFAWMIAYKSDK